MLEYYIINMGLIRNEQLTRLLGLASGCVKGVVLVWN